MLWAWPEKEGHLGAGCSQHSGPGAGRGARGGNAAKARSNQPLGVLESQARGLD